MAVLLSIAAPGSGRDTAGFELSLIHISQGIVR